MSKLTTEPQAEQVVAQRPQETPPIIWTLGWTANSGRNLSEGVLHMSPNLFQKLTRFGTQGLHFPQRSIEVGCKDTLVWVGLENWLCEVAIKATLLPSFKSEHELTAKKKGWRVLFTRLNVTSGQ